MIPLVIYLRWTRKPRVIHPGVLLVFYFLKKILQNLTQNWCYPNTNHCFYSNILPFFSNNSNCWTWVHHFRETVERVFLQRERVDANEGLVDYESNLQTQNSNPWNKLHQDVCELLYLIFRRTINCALLTKMASFYLNIEIKVKNNPSCNKIHAHELYAFRYHKNIMHVQLFCYDEVPWLLY